VQITRSSLNTAKGPDDWFAGDVYIDAVAAAPPPSRITANLVHFMPGAAANRLMVHLSINEADADHDVVHWLQPVTDDEYAAAPAVD
jgi:hypothetical protein